MFLTNLTEIFLRFSSARSLCTHKNPIFSVFFSSFTFLCFSYILFIFSFKSIFTLWHTGIFSNFFSFFSLFSQQPVRLNSRNLIKAKKRKGNVKSVSWSLLLLLLDRRCWMCSVWMFFLCGGEWDGAADWMDGSKKKRNEGKSPKTFFLLGTFQAKKKIFSPQLDSIPTHLDHCKHWIIAKHSNLNGENSVVYCAEAKWVFVTQPGLLVVPLLQWPLRCFLSTTLALRNTLSARRWHNRAFAFFLFPRDEIESLIASLCCLLVWLTN